MLLENRNRILLSFVNGTTNVSLSQTETEKKKKQFMVYFLAIFVFTKFECGYVN